MTPPPPARRGTFLEASAGTGKTTQLVQAIADAIADEVPVNRIVAVTFTHQAAGEMKLRVRQKLGEIRTRTAMIAVQALDQAFIGTIHSFCASLLRQRPIEAHVDPDFHEMDEGQARRLFTDVFRWWIERQFTNPMSSTMRQAFSRLSWMDSHDGPIRRMEEAAWELVKWRDHPAPWEKRELRREEKVRALWLRTNSMLSNWPPGECDWGGSILKDIVRRLKAAEDAGVADLNESENVLLSIPRRLKKVRLNPRNEAGREWGELLNGLYQYSVLAEADLASRLRDDLWMVVKEYEGAKGSTGRLDFTDLLLKTRNLLRNKGARSDLQARYDLVFVDEFQDTDPLQAEILTSLVPPERLFVVGDPKQSIYRFRRAEPRVYTETRERMKDAGAVVRPLTSSYRSTDAIQAFVNAAFRDMTDYSPLTGGPAAPTDQPSLIALPVPMQYDGDSVQSKAILDSTPSAVGAFIHWLLRDSKWTVRERDTRRKIKPEDICILFRRMTNNRRDLSQDYVRSLEARGIDHVLVGSKGLHQREEVAAIRTALRAIEWPDDELSVYAVLRGPLFGIADATLLKFRTQHGRLSVFSDKTDDDLELEPVWDALAVLRELHRERNHKPAADTIRRLLGAVRGHAIFAFYAGGMRRLANLNRIAELARQSEAGATISFRALVRWLEEEAESGETAEAPVFEQQSGGVRLMTVHKAKGLEFPVVILADPSAGLTGLYGVSRWVDSKKDLCAQRILECAPWELIDHEAEEEVAELEEAVRVTYVASTRAKDLLVVCAVGDMEQKDWWLSPLYDVLYPEKMSRTRSEEPLGCPRVGNLTVLNAPIHNAEPQIRPGSHKPRAGTHRVVWFDPAVLSLEAPAPGSEPIDLLRPQTSQIAEGLERYWDWQARTSGAITEGARPQLTVQRITEAGEIPGAEGIPVEVILIKTGVPQRSGRTYGKLLHAVLQSGGGAELHGRRLAATPEEVQTAAATAEVVIAHPFVAANGRDVYRELPIVAKLDDGCLLEGRMDLVLTDGREWTVVDYKTDSTNRARYRRQLQTYGLALQRATGKPARGILLEIGS